MSERDYCQSQVNTTEYVTAHRLFSDFKHNLITGLYRLKFYILPESTLFFQKVVKSFFL